MMTSSGGGEIARFEISETTIAARQTARAAISSKQGFSRAKLLAD
jgi:hypothetical protein